MKPTLVVLAAGIGSRYGGLKQLDPVGPGGATLMDYTIYDALQIGVEKVVMVVQKRTEEEVRAHVDKGAGSKVEVVYVHQDIHAVPLGFVVTPGRSKPWGTGQALMAAARTVDAGRARMAPCGVMTNRSAQNIRFGRLGPTGSTS